MPKQRGFKVVPLLWPLALAPCLASLVNHQATIPRLGLERVQSLRGQRLGGVDRGAKYGSLGLGKRHLGTMLTAASKERGSGLFCAIEMGGMQYSGKMTVWARVENFVGFMVWSPKKKLGGELASAC